MTMINQNISTFTPKMKELESKAAQIRLNTLNATIRSGRGCTGDLMSLIEILVTLYYGRIGNRNVAMVNTLKPGWEDQDYVVLSKRSATLALYAVLADLGFFDKSELDFYGQPGSLLTDFPSAKIPGVAASIFGNGYGLSVALGIALSLKMERASNKVFIILGDDELNYGQVWEAAAIAAHHKLDNLICFVDNAKVEVEATVLSTPKVTNIQDKFESFGWKVIPVADGHDFIQLLDASAKAFATARVPTCILCHTVAGKGVPFAEYKEGYLKAVLSENELLEVVSKLKALV